MPPKKSISQYLFLTPKEVTYLDRFWRAFLYPDTVNTDIVTKTTGVCDILHLSGSCFLFLFFCQIIANFFSSVILLTYFLSRYVRNKNIKGFSEQGSHSMLQNLNKFLNHKVVIWKVTRDRWHFKRFFFKLLLLFISLSLRLVSLGPWLACLSIKVHFCQSQSARELSHHLVIVHLQSHNYVLWLFESMCTHKGKLSVQNQPLEHSRSHHVGKLLGW